MSNGNGHRWSKFWWQDWQNDVALKRCGLAAHGLWMAMLCIAHEGEPCGFLRLGGKPLTTEDIAEMIPKTSVKEVAKLLAELETKSVFSRADDGAIFCRRMVKDAALSEVGKEHAEKRWNGGQPTGPPNGVPIGGAIGEASRKPNGKGNGEAYSQAYRDPNARSLEAEADSEAEAEARKKREESKTTLFSSSVLRTIAREDSPPESAHSVLPEDEAEAGDGEDRVTRSRYDELHDVPTHAQVLASRAAFAEQQRNLAADAAAMIAKALRTKPEPRPYGPVRSRQEQLEALAPRPPTRSPDAAGMEWQPAEPPRTPAQQLVVLLGITHEEAEARIGNLSHAA